MGRIFEHPARRAPRERRRNSRRWRDARDLPFTEGQVIPGSGAIGPAMPATIDEVGR
jgi:hypothetical protein